MFQPLKDRASVIARAASELRHHGLPETTGELDREMLVMLCGVGRFQISALMIRTALRRAAPHIGTALYDWQFGLPGEIWTDLMWYRRNRVMGVRVARKLLQLRRAHPSARIHLWAYSGGAGVLLFALEALRRRVAFSTVILAAPAVRPDYPLHPALASAERCYALVSYKDSVLLGLGTRIFGTTDRTFTQAAGRVGFRRPESLDADAQATYARLQQIFWTPELAADGCGGGHISWIQPRFLAKHLPALLAGEPLLPAQEIVE